MHLHVFPPQYLQSGRTDRVWGRTSAAAASLSLSVLRQSQHMFRKLWIFGLLLLSNRVVNAVCSGRGGWGIMGGGL